VEPVTTRIRNTIILPPRMTKALIQGETGTMADTFLIAQRAANARDSLELLEESEIEIFEELLTEIT